MRRVSIFAALFALLFVVSAPVSAAPKGDARDPDVGKKLYQFNVLAKPNAWVADSTTCPNNGSRIFFQEDGDNTLGTLHWTLDPEANQDFNITDCNGTVDGDGDIVADESINFWVMIKLVGPKTSTLTNTCTDVLDVIGVDDLCLLNGTPVHLSRNATTKIMQNVAENELEGVLWEFSGDWKVFQVLIYEAI